MLDLGPCQVLFGDPGNEVDLGVTSGGVRFIDEISTQDLTTDQFGESPVDSVVTGRNVRVECKFADIRQNLELWAKVLPGAQLTGTPPNQKLTVKRNVGENDRSVAKRLILKRIVGDVPSTDKRDWIICPIATPRASPSLDFDATTQRALDVTFKIYPDLTTGVYYIMGDESL
jgi:hypothetical protein